MAKLLIVGLGGFLGSVVRYSLSGWVHKIFEHPYPYGTFAVNIVGCLLIGFLAGFAESRHYIGHDIRLFLLVGFLGGFTTFSALCNETFLLLGEGQMLAAIFNVGLSVIFGLTAVFGGYYVSSLV